MPRGRAAKPRPDRPLIPHEESAAGTATLEAAMAAETNPIKRFFLLLGPGLVTGASDDDPSGIGPYAVAGASFGFATLWTALLSFPLMTATQVICSRIGRVTGRGLASGVGRRAPRLCRLAQVDGQLPTISERLQTPSSDASHC